MCRCGTPFPSVGFLHFLSSFLSGFLIFFVCVCVCVCVCVFFFPKYNCWFFAGGIVRKRNRCQLRCVRNGETASASLSLSFWASFLRFPVRRFALVSWLLLCRFFFFLLCFLILFCLFIFPLGENVHMETHQKRRKK